MEICSLPVPTKNGKSLDEIRKSAKFHPSIWGDFFLKYNSDNTKFTDAEQEELTKHKETVRKLLAQTPDDSTYKLELIDLIQRLGVEYHFEKEIEESLKYIHDNSRHQISKDSDDLRTVALRFHLLRQQGYNVPCDVFQKFTDKEGNYVASLENNVEGLLNLYEAAHLGTRGEDILDRALEFCSTHLHASVLLNEMSNVYLSKRVNEALVVNMPVRKTLTRYGARKFISMYQEAESRNEILLNFAKLDFNRVLMMHQRELSDLTRWWKKFDVASKMPYARDRIVELFLWMMGVFFEPCYAKARSIIVRSTSIISMIDDTYEYATLDELQVLTDAIQSWDVNEALEDSPRTYPTHCKNPIMHLFMLANETNYSINLQTRQP